MPRRSKVELSSETIAELEEQFFSFLHSLSPEETNKFFNEFLTNEEKMMMYKRLALYWSLYEGYSLASIQRMLGITHDTTRIYNKKKNEMSDDFKNLLHRIGRDGNGQPIKEAVIEEKREEVNEQQEEIDAVKETPSEMEKIMEVKSSEEAGDNVIESFDEAVKSEESESQEKEKTMETESENNREQTTESKEEDNENPEKKKSGFAKFFGF